MPKNFDFYFLFLIHFNFFGSLSIKKLLSHFLEQNQYCLPTDFIKTFPVPIGISFEQKLHFGI